MIHPERWKSMLGRYAQERPRRMLALDGGAIRSLITLGILEQVEALVRAQTGQQLCDYFDYIAGTSTGSIVAAGLARGLTVGDLIQFYQDNGTQMFDKSFLVE